MTFSKKKRGRRSRAEIDAQRSKYRVVLGDAVQTQSIVFVL